ncbi:MAG: hypothetical protein LBG21_00950 [Campylobacteraceae bacterium]|nr:hypothetical protein [Campylobacteraceae bacterium]
MTNHDKYKKRSIKTTYGEDNPDKTFYIIRIPQDTVGLFSIILTNLTHITYAVKNGYIPVVDLKNIKNLYSDGKSNAWELFFEQPMGYDLDDIAASKNIILSSLERIHETYSMNVNEIYYNQYKDKFLVFKDIYKKYIKANQSSLEYIQTDFNAVFQHGRRVLGVLCRGTDYTLKKPKGHPIQPETIDIIKKAKEIIKKYNCSHIYLATEDESVYELFKSYFRDILLTNRQKRFTNEELKDVRYLAQINRDREDDKYLTALEYLSSINILSKCNCFMGGRTSGTAGVYFMSDGFEYDYTWDIGVYQ